VVALEEDDARSRRRASARDARPVGLPVVVSEHSNYRDLQAAARVGDDAHLVDPTVLGQIPGSRIRSG